MWFFEVKMGIKISKWITCSNNYYFIAKIKTNYPTTSVNYVKFFVERILPRIRCWVLKQFLFKEPGFVFYIWGKQDKFTMVSHCTSSAIQSSLNNSQGDIENTLHLNFPLPIRSRISKLVRRNNLLVWIDLAGKWLSLSK